MGGRELFLQALVLTLQSLTRLLRFLKLSTQAINFSIEIGQRWGLWLGCLARFGHAPVMPESTLQYKRNPANQLRQIVAAQKALPVIVRIYLVDECGPVLPPVTHQIGLTIS